MVAHNSEPPHALTLDEIDEVADIRARVGSWEVAALAIGWNVTDLRRAARRDPRFQEALEAAIREMRQDAEAEAIIKFRAQIRSDDTKVAGKAAEQLAKFLTAIRKDETRLAVAKLNAETKCRVEELRGRNRVEVAKLQASCRRQSQQEEGPRMGTDGYPDPELTEEEARVQEQIARRHDAQYAEEVARTNAVVYLWGGCHKLGDTAPDQTDTPLQLVSDMTVPGCKRLYWALTNPPPVIQPLEGPFLPPPGCRPATYPDTLYQDGRGGHRYCDAQARCVVQEC